jgi:hypothetical protein
MGPCHRIDARKLGPYAIGTRVATTFFSNKIPFFFSVHSFVHMALAGELEPVHLGGRDKGLAYMPDMMEFFLKIKKRA